MEIKKPGRRAPRKRNPSGKGFKALLAQVLPALSAGGIGALEGWNPGWWADLPKLAKGALVLGAGLFFDSRQAGKHKNERLGCALQGVGGYMIGQEIGAKGKQVYLEHTVSANMAPQPEASDQSNPDQGGLGALFDRSPQYQTLYESLDHEMDAVADRYGLVPDADMGALFAGYQNAPSY